MNQNNKIDPKSIGILGLIFLVVFIWTSCQSDKNAEIAKEALDGQKAEEVLALLDTKQDPPHPEDVQRYAKVLDQLEKKCFETREEIALVTFSLTKSSIEAGFEEADNFEAHLDSLKTVLMMAEGFNDPSAGAYIPLVTEMIKENKQAIQENQQYEAEQQEEEAARQRQQQRENSN